MEHVSPVQIGNCRWLAPGYRPVCSLVRTRYCNVMTHWVHYWLARNSKIQETGESFQVLGLTFSTHLSPTYSQGRVSLGFFFPDTKYVLLSANIQCLTAKGQTTVSSHLIPYLCADATGWVIKTALTSDASHVVLRYQASDQQTGSWTFHDPNFMLKHSIEPATKLRRLLTHCPHMMVQDKIRNTEMEDL